MMKKILYQPFFIKLFNWEYWPFHIVYGPVYLYWCWLAVKARSFFFINTSNPSIINGGFLMESKKEIYDLIPAAYYPPTLFFKKGTSIEKIMAAINERHLQFPLIGKPDIGMQGKAVKKLTDITMVLEYAVNSKVDFLVQEFVAHEKEVGIFYYRYPGEANGHISGIVEKEFLSITGDGVSGMETLLQKEKRYILQLPVLRKTYGDELKNVLKHGEECLLVPYGNHVRGAKFIDGSHLIDEELTRTIDHVCRQIEGFYFGRLDIRYNSREELKQGKNFSIIELNGAGSEPTHIYDPKHSIFFAWKEIIRHLNILARISRINHRVLKKPYLNIREGLAMLKANKRYVKLINEDQHISNKNDLLREILCSGEIYIIKSL
ncbi:MAG: hypothetical protein ACXWWC_13830 [Chitinophagaceae bacterium]